MNVCTEGGINFTSCYKSWRKHTQKQERGIYGSSPSADSIYQESERDVSGIAFKEVHEKWEGSV